MSIMFHDGTNQLYKGYVNNKAWDDDELLRLDNDTNTNRRLRAWNNEEDITGILSMGSVKGHKLSGYVSSLKSYIEADEDTASIIVVKGLHQPNGANFRWEPHVTIGLDAYLWHLYFTWTRDDTMYYAGSSKGPKATGSTHDGWNVA